MFESYTLVHEEENLNGNRQWTSKPNYFCVKNYTKIPM